MKRRLDVTPQARRDIVSILGWYRENLGARAAQKVAQTIQSRLRSLESGRVKGAELTGGSSYMRAVAKKHVIVFTADDATIRLVRIVHGSQDMEAIAAELTAKE
jgi:plasmid stabilization system protein ParE